jgi:tRNA G10  N-methylase Trm11
MNDYFFFLGRNSDLSLQEIISYLEARGIMGNYCLESSIALFSLKEEINPREMIEKLGGTIKIGKTTITGKHDDILGQIKKLNLYSGEKDKLKFSVSVYPEDAALAGSLKEILDEFFKEEGIKALFRQPSETPTGSIKFDLEFFLIRLKKDYYFGEIMAVYDSKDVEFRDMHKPFRRSEYAIPPRIAKILINMSGVIENETLLDPFCGVGTILQEAILQKVNAIGADIDPGVIENCQRNMSWIIKNYNTQANVKIFTSNAIDLPNVIKEKVDAIASEPFLVPLITYTPKDKEATKMITKAKYTYITTLNELKKLLKDGGRIALSLPVMKARESKVHLRIDEICIETGLKLIAGPFPEAREDQRVSREIIILEK